MPNQNDDNERDERYDDAPADVVVHSVFEAFERYTNTPSHAERDVDEAVRSFVHSGTGDMRAFFNEQYPEILEHASSINTVATLFPEATTVGGSTPQIVDEPTGWVNAVWGRVSRRPFSHLRTIGADFTTETARARGYINGDEKIEDYFDLFTRTTTPQFVYKVMQLERGDLAEITGFNVVNWLRTHMIRKLNEELAQAVLIGDGRLASDRNKIREDNIRPIYSDDPMYAERMVLDPQASLGTVTSTLAQIDGVTEAMMNYRGSGNPAFYCSPEVYIRMQLLRNQSTQERYYRTRAELTAALGVSQIVIVPPLSGVGRPAHGDTAELVGILVNMRDYSIGSTRLGKVKFFDDFNLRLNQHDYLIETQVAGALMVPKSAIIVEVLIGGGQQQ